MDDPLLLPVDNRLEPSTDSGLTLLKDIPRASREVGPNRVALDGVRTFKGKMLHCPPPVPPTPNPVPPPVPPTPVPPPVPSNPTPTPTPVPPNPNPNPTPVPTPVPPTPNPTPTPTRSSILFYDRLFSQSLFILKTTLVTCKAALAS